MMMMIIIIIIVINQQMKERLKKEQTRRLRMTLKSELNAKNKTTALACPVLRYVFCIINLKLEEISKIDRETRNELTVYKMHHPKADIDRVYEKRKEGERGLLQIETTYEAEIINIAEYLNTKIYCRPNINIVKVTKAINQI